MKSAGTIMTNHFGLHEFRRVSRGGGMQSVLKDVSAGRDMLDSMKEYPKVFGPIYVSVVRSGKINEAMEQLLSYLEQIDAFSRKVRPHPLSRTQSSC